MSTDSSITHILKFELQSDSSDETPNETVSSLKSQASALDKNVVDIEPIPSNSSQALQKNFCPTCNHTYSSQSKLRRHLREVHEKIKEYNCTYCTKKFIRKEQLERHQLMSHKLDSLQEMLSLVDATSSANKKKSKSEEEMSTLEKLQMFLPFLNCSKCFQILKQIVPKQSKHLCSENRCQANEKSMSEMQTINVKEEMDLDAPQSPGPPTIHHGGPQNIVKYGPLINPSAEQVIKKNSEGMDHYHGSFLSKNIRYPPTYEQYETYIEGMKTKIPAHPYASVYNYSYGLNYGAHPYPTPGNTYNSTINQGNSPKSFTQKNK